MSTTNILNYTNPDFFFTKPSSIVFVKNKQTGFVNKNKHKKITHLTFKFCGLLLFFLKKGEPSLVPAVLQGI